MGLKLKEALLMQPGYVFTIAFIVNDVTRKLYTVGIYSTVEKRAKRTPDIIVETTWHSCIIDRAQYKIISIPAKQMSLKNFD